MADVHTSSVRSYNMSRIKSKNTGPELIVRKFLFAHGIRYRLHVKELPGKPDIVIGKYKTIVDIRGCFWHGHKGCRFGDKVKSESIGITGRVHSAVERDKRNEKLWKELGWKLIVVWDSCELEIKKKISERREVVLKNLLKRILENSDTSN
ncbi:MAG: DNA mismatch endonuclease Vsr [Chitinophagaceae bacterium]|nr:DNA mismatch endonuclease Vsr [Chitinophagaceae bacterium]